MFIRILLPQKGPLKTMCETPNGILQSPGLDSYFVLDTNEDSYVVAAVTI